MIAERTAEARRAERQAADFTRQAETGRAQLAAPVTPGQERARAVGEVLDRADQFATERNDEHQARETMRSAQEIHRQLLEAHGKSRLALRLAGTTRCAPSTSKGRARRTGRSSVPGGPPRTRGAMHGPRSAALRR